MTLYHLALAEDWAQALAAGRYPWSTRGRSVAEVGFIHLSHGTQVAATAGRYYGDCTELVVLHVDPALLPVPVIEEPAPSGERFPHLYAELPVSAVVRATPWQRVAPAWSDPPLAG